MPMLKKRVLLICIISIICTWSVVSAEKANYTDPLIGPESSTPYDNMLRGSATTYTFHQIIDVQDTSEKYWVGMATRNNETLRKSLADGLANTEGSVRSRLLQNALKSMDWEHFLEAFAMSEAVLLDWDMMNELDGYWKQRLLILTHDSFQAFSDKEDAIKLYHRILQLQEKYIPTILQDIERKSNILEDLAQRYSETGSERSALALRELRVQTLEGEREDDLYLDALNQLAATYIKLEQYGQARELLQKVILTQPVGADKRADVLKTRAEILLMRTAVEAEDNTAITHFLKNPAISAEEIGDWLLSKKDMPQDGEERLNMQDHLVLYAKSLFLGKDYEKGKLFLAWGQDLGIFYDNTHLHPVDHYNPSLPLPRRITLFRELKSAQLENLAMIGTAFSRSGNKANALDAFIQCAYWQWVLDYNNDCFETWKGLLSLASECRSACMFPEAQAFLNFGHQRAMEELGSNHSLTLSFAKEQAKLKLWQDGPSLMKSTPPEQRIQFENILESMWDSFEAYPLDVRRRAFSWMLPVYKMKIDRLLSLGTHTEDEIFRTTEMCKSRLFLSTLSRRTNHTEDLTEDEKKHYHDMRRNLFESSAQSYRKSESYCFREEVFGTGAGAKSYVTAMFFCYHTTISWMRQYKEFCHEMAKKSPSWNHSPSYTPMTLDEGLEFLPEHAAYINFLQITPNHILAVILDKTKGFQTVEYDLPWDLSSKCTEYYRLISFPDLLEVAHGKKFLWRLPDRTYQARGAGEKPDDGVPSTLEEYRQDREKLAVELGNALLAPLRPYISENASHWILSPDNSMAIIPFETLSYQEKPLVASVDVSYLQSLTAGKFLKERQIEKRQPEEKRLLAVGNPNYARRIIDPNDKEYLKFFDTLGEWSKEWSQVPGVLRLKEWSNLSGTGKEIEEVVECFDYHDLLTGDKATKRQLFALNNDDGLTRYSHILFAAHGAVLPDCPDYPVLVLGRDNYNVEDNSGNGILDIFEVMQLDLNSDLVYLSACETGLGQYQTGEGIFGLPMAFNVAGNRDTVMSLWKIDDAAAAVFSGKFFQEIADGVPPAKALSAIKREWLQKPDGEYDDPYFWTPMILYGIP